MARRKGRAPTTDELSLWRDVAKSMRPRSAQPSPPPEVLPPPKVDLKPRPLMTTTAAVTFRPKGRSEPPIRVPDPPKAVHSGLDRRTEERLRKGQRAPDARIDLHGMTAARAHGALIGFISNARSQGLRCVLVITGKGAPGPTRDFGDPSPGVLRREAPIWLRTPPLSSMIVHISQAHPRHGGGGALYVYLKKR